MEILQIVARWFPARPLGSDFVVCAALPTPMDCGEILKENPGAVEECQQRSIMIGGQRINASLDIGEVLLEKNSHIGVEAFAVRHGQIGVCAWPRFVNSSLRPLG